MDTSENRSPMRVLIVDDDREDAELVEDLLEDVAVWHVEVAWASTYERGVEEVREGDWDVCLLDFHLGARTGVDFLGEPAVDASRIPVILLTGQGTPEVDRRAWEAGAADYLPKDGLTALLLERAIRYAVERRRRRRAEARFDALVGNAREMVSVLDPEGTLLYVSPSLRRVLGFEPEEKVGEPSLEEVHPDDRERVGKALAAVLAEPQGEQHLQYRVRHADGSWRVLDTVGRNCMDDPDVRGVVVSSWDVTERVKQGERIRFQAELLDAVGQAVVATDMGGRVIYWNRAAESIYGRSEKEALGRDVVEITPSDATREQAREIMDAMLAGETWTGEFEVARKDGSSFPALVTNTPIFDEEGRQTGIVGVSSDISRIKETEADLRERVKELRTLYGATRLMQRHDLPLEARLQGVVDAIPPGFLYPDVTGARLVLPEASLASEGFRETEWMLSAEIVVEDAAVGRLDVVLTEERPERDEGPFLREERDLLNAVAQTVGEALERARLNRHLSQTISSLEEAVLVIDSRGYGRKIQSVNPAAARIFGYRPEEMTGRTTEFLHANPESFRRFAEEGNPVLERGEVFHAEYPMKRKDGTVFHAEQTVALLDPVHGLEGGAVSVIRDVSEARQAEAELRATEERFREIAEHIDSVFWVFSPQKRKVEYVSPAYEEIWGRDPSELYEDPDAWTRSVHPEDFDRVRRFRAAQVEEEPEAEYRIVRPDGGVRWIHDRAFPVRNDRGGVERVVGVAEDVTGRKEAEERLGLLSREISEVIYIRDPDGTVRFATPSVEAVTGYPREEFEGTDSFELVHEEDRHRVRELQLQMVDQPEASIRAEYRFVHRDGRVRYAEAVGRNLLGHPGVDGFLVTMWDVTERVELEKSLQQSQRLEAVGRLAGGIAHDFNNLLTVIRSQTDLLLLDLPAEEPSAEEVAVIQAAADRAARLTAQLLAFSREQVLQPRVVQLCEVVRRMAGLVDRVIGEDVEVRLGLEGDLPPVRVDPGQLEQVVINLAINARDAMPRGGVLALETFEREFDQDEAQSRELVPGIYTCLRVSDTGVGIESAIVTQIFEPFFTTKGDTGGTGLGLSTAYGFMRQSGGSIEVQSSLGEGTVFTLCFPRSDGEVEEVPSRETAALPRARTAGTVLVVEDDDSVRRVAVRILERAGLDVLQAASAEAALETLERGHAVAAVLTDLVLPGMSGRELLDRLGEERPDLPVVVMSGYAADSPGHRGDLSAEIPFIQKPFTPATLTEAVRRAIERGRPPG